MANINKHRHLHGRITHDLLHQSPLRTSIQEKQRPSTRATASTHDSWSNRTANSAVLVWLDLEPEHHLGTASHLKCIYWDGNAGDLLARNGKTFQLDKLCIDADYCIAELHNRHIWLLREFSDRREHFYPFNSGSGIPSVRHKHVHIEYLYKHDGSSLTTWQVPRSRSAMGDIASCLPLRGVLTRAYSVLQVWP